ncbi:MAG TPA: TrkA C-terminal domain-containing protein [Micromonosporaceae bacterium]
MRVRVEKTTLPGIGVRQDVVTSCGQRVGVVTRYSGERYLVVYDQDDPDARLAAVPLTDDEAVALGDILGTSMLLSQLSGLGTPAAGLLTEQISIDADSRYAGRTLGDTKARTRTGSSIVAVLRDGKVIPTPEPSFRFEIGDVLVAIGTRKGLEALTAILAGSETGD